MNHEVATLVGAGTVTIVASVVVLFFRSRKVKKLKMLAGFLLRETSYRRAIPVEWLQLPNSYYVKEKLDVGENRDGEEWGVLSVRRYSGLGCPSGKIIRVKVPLSLYRRVVKDEIYLIRYTPDEYCPTDNEIAFGDRTSKSLLRPGEIEEALEMQKAWKYTM